MKLPLFLNAGNKHRVGWLWALILGALYMSANHQNFFEPYVLQMTWIDREMPFLPWTFWIYASLYVLYGVVYLTSRDMKNTNQYLYAILALQTVSVIIFWIWPTTFPRGDYPIPEDTNAVLKWVFENFRKIDTPKNCAPSLHVSSCYLSSFVFLQERRKLFPFFFIWATAVAFTTLTTKQHYVIDIILAIPLAVGCWWFFHRKAQYKKTVYFNPTWPKKR
jgi:membrane-associated phospholipid phosphatase